MTKIRVLVTGATGFIGKPAVEELLRQGYEVHIIGRRRPDIKGAWFHECDLLALRNFRPIIGSVGATHLLHLAWDVAPGKFWTDAANLDWMETTSGCFVHSPIAAGNVL